MSTPINLNKVRKARAKVARKAKADENAVAFGRSKSQKAQQRAADRQAQRHVEAHKRDG